MQKFNWNLEPSSGWGLDVDGAPMVADASDQQKFQHTWPLITMQACFRHRKKKVKIVIVTFYLTIHTFIGIVSLHLAIQTLSEL